MLVGGQRTSTYHRLTVEDFMNRKECSESPFALPTHVDPESPEAAKYIRDVGDGVKLYCNEAIIEAINNRARDEAVVYENEEDALLAGSLISLASRGKVPTYKDKIYLDPVQ